MICACHFTKYFIIVYCCFIYPLTEFISLVYVLLIFYRPFIRLHVAPPARQGLTPSTGLPWSLINRYCPQFSHRTTTVWVLSDFPRGHPSWNYSHWSMLNFGVPKNLLAKRSKKVSIFIEGNLFSFKHFLHHPGDVGFDIR